MIIFIITEKSHVIFPIKQRKVIKFSEYNRNINEELANMVGNYCL
jgi:hypothetical protein